MSNPTGKHLWEPRLGETWMPQRFIEMRCDGGPISILGHCPNTPKRAPRLVVPSRRSAKTAAEWGWLDPETPPIRRFTTLHFCELHKAECTAARLLAEPGCIAVIERAAKRRWPHGTVPDFDNAAVEWLLTTTPDYLDFLARIEQGLTMPEGVPLL